MIGNLALGRKIASLYLGFLTSKIRNNHIFTSQVISKIKLV
jgi:hypothetical protein